MPITWVSPTTPPTTTITRLVAVWLERPAVADCTPLKVVTNSAKTRLDSVAMTLVSSLQVSVASFRCAPPADHGSQPSGLGTTGHRVEKTSPQLAATTASITSSRWLTSTTVSWTSLDVVT